MSDITGSTALTGNTYVNIYDPQAPAYLLRTSLGVVSLTDQLPSIVVTSDLIGGIQIGITEDSAANAAQVIIDKPTAGTSLFKVDATGTGSTAIGFQAASAQSLSNLTINGTDATHNNALFEVIAVQAAVGAQIGGGALNNYGFLEVDSQNTATGVNVTGTGSVSNTLQIHVQALNGVGVAFANASGASFTNSGNAIMQVDELTGGSSVGIAFGGAYASGQWLTVTNAGDLHADTAIQAQTGGVSSTSIVHLTNTGTIEGTIQLGIGPSAVHGAGSQVINNGQITGNVYLDTNGDDLYDSSQGAGSATAIYLGSGTDTVHLGSAGGVVHSGAGAAVITGTTGAMTVYGGAGAETITGSSAADWLQGGSGNDTLSGGAGSDTLDGGAGLNTALYGGGYRQYTVGAGGATVSGGPEGGTDTLTNIQRIQFVDGYVATSPTDMAGEVYRLYEATLNRGPDPEGLAGWVHQLAIGTSLQTVANGFVGSTEFQADYGNLNNNDFVTLLYNNVLHRAPDSAGLNGWVGFLNSGQDTRAQVVLGFSESPEDISNSTPAVEQGLWVGDVDAAQVARLYDTALGRLPDLPGLTGWTQALENGTLTLLQEMSDFVGSTEFQAVYGNLSNTAFVTQLYANALHRAPDAGLNAWVSLLNSGQDTRAQVVLGFSESPEHIADTAPHIDGGIWLA